VRVAEPQPLSEWPTIRSERASTTCGLSPFSWNGVSQEESGEIIQNGPRDNTLSEDAKIVEAGMVRRE
jgi:hypothetical protein